MAVPKHKRARPGTRSRRSANMRIGQAAQSSCSNCGSTKLPHVVCSNCGYYKGRQIIDVE